VETSVNISAGGWFIAAEAEARSPEKTETSRNSVLLPAGPAIDPMRKCTNNKGLKKDHDCND
jgi:hypothetical protein